RIERIDRGRTGVAERQDVRRATLARRLERLLVFPLRSGDRGAAVQTPVLANRRLLRQRRAEPRPQDQDDDVEGAWRIDRVLEMPGRQHRLVLPPIGLDGEEPAVFLSKLVDDEIGA